MWLRCLSTLCRSIRVLHPQVTYTSKPQAAGGPYRSLPGRIIFPGQRPTQSIQVGQRRWLDQCSHCRLAARDPAPTAVVLLVLVQSGRGALPLPAHCPQSPLPPTRSRPTCW